MQEQITLLRQIIGPFLPSMLPRLCLELQSEFIPQEELRRELHYCQEQIEAYDEAVNLAHERYQEAREQRQLQQQAQLRRENAHNKIQDCEKILANFTQQLCHDFLRTVSPSFLEYPRPSQHTNQSSKQMESQLIETLDLLSAQGVMAPEPLLYFVEEPQRSQFLHLLQEQCQHMEGCFLLWQQQQDQRPISLERLRTAQQQQQQATTMLEQARKMYSESECERERMQQQLQQQMAELWQCWPSSEPITGPESSLKSLQQQFLAHLEAAQKHKEQCQKHWDQVMQERAWQQEKAQLLQADLSNAQQAWQSAQVQWQQDMEQSGFVDISAFLAAELEDEAQQEQLAKDWEIDYRESQRHLYETRQQLVQFPISNLVAGHKTGDQTLHQQLLETPSMSSQKQLCTRLAQEIAQIDEHIQQIKADGQNASEALGALKKSLADDDNLQQEQKKIFQELGQQGQALAHWKQLNELIGSKSGDKYSRFAQQLSFEQLLYQANLYLEKIHDRYLLQSLNENPLEFFVIDLYQQQCLRPSKNLSGGEKFLVSLALALALAHISAKQVPVQSLFLDEGFGTLDEETLHSTLEVLGSLRNEGKLIGLISHIPALKERIMCQIQLKSLGEGRSAIQGIPGIVTRLK